MRHGWEEPEIIQWFLCFVLKLLKLMNWTCSMKWHTYDILCKHAIEMTSTSTYGNWLQPNAPRGNSVSPACWTEKGTSGQVNQMGHNGPSKSIKCMVEERLKWYDPLFTSFHLQGTFNLQVTSMESYTCNCTNLILADAIKWIQRMQKINTARLCGSCLGFLHVLPSFLL